MAVLMWCSGLLTFYGASNAILGLTATVLLPLYFSFCGAEAAIRFSLLLCVHAVILSCIPQSVKSIIPMVQIVLFLMLLLLPINVTPFVAVWFYEKLLLLAEPLLSIIEAGQVVLFVMFASQSLVDKMEEKPTLVKASVIGIAIISYFLMLWMSFGLFMDTTTTTLENWTLLAIIAVSISVLIICLIKDEGIISDASILSLVMTCILWAMKQERIMSTNPLHIPKHWTQSFSGGKSFLGAFISMASSSLSQLGQAQVTLRNLVSPTYLALAAVRVSSAVCFIWLQQKLWAEKPEETEEVHFDENRDDRNWNFKISPLAIRLIFIFVYTEFLVRSMVISTHHSMSGHSFSSATTWQILPSWIGTIVYGVLYEVRLWRVLQLVVVVVTYFYMLFNMSDEY